MAVGNGLKTFFLIDNWIFNEPIINFTIVEIDIVDNYKHVSDYWSSKSGWKLEDLHGLIPNFVIEKLQACIINEDLDNQDILY